MHFQVLVEGRPRRVNFEFGKSRDLRSISHWRVPPKAMRNPAVRDTVEFARLATKRHRHYLRSIPTASSISQFQRIVRKNEVAEVAVLLLVRASWFKRSPIIGLAQCRRSFCHHLLLEFLSVHPAIVGNLDPRISGVGKGLVYALGSLADRLNIKLIWGEPTAHSAPFYSHILGTPGIDDRLSISGNALKRCQKGFREIFDGQLD
ncbi:MAG: hypothetical protein C5B50_12620 [Verrucomicrobia bacterium]|nr:MAG: hypothetical protein C5B50_12620 [Verrucomicrobiota bacterium]